MNQVSLVGRLTRDPEVRKTQTGLSICNFSLAVSRAKAKDGQQTADFPNCIAFGKVADALGNFCRKGEMIGVQGRIQTGSYTNKQGVKVYTTDVAVDNIDFLNPPAKPARDQNYQQGINTYGNSNFARTSPQNGNSGQSNQFNSQFQSYGLENDYGITDDDLPF